MTSGNFYRNLPAVDQLAAKYAGRLPPPLLADAARVALTEARNAIAAGDDPNVDETMVSIIRRKRRLAGIEVINATGVLLHTNLGRASWSRGAAENAMTAATSPSNLEMDLDSGDRSPRGGYVAELLSTLTGAEDAVVVNNNAAGLLLCLTATSAGRGVAVARGELIEIGGSFRLPQVMEMSGARLVEVGTTNRTRAEDYLLATQLHDIAALLKIHPSNYRLEGFTEQATVEQLGILARDDGIPLIYDVGSGLLDASTPWLDGPPPCWLRDEPAVRQSLQEGADLVTFSGDKLLGGPQAGIVVGSKTWISHIRDNPLTRALRVDGPTYAALGATLESFARRTVDDLPFWRQAMTSIEQVEQRARQIADALGGRVESGFSMVGAGSVPGTGIPSTIVFLDGDDHLFERLLASDHPVLTRRERGALVIDPRSFDSALDQTVIGSVIECRS